MSEAKPEVDDAAATPQTWYFLRPTSRLREFFNLLHLPYTGMVLAFVVTAAALAPVVHLDRMLATMLAYFLGLGVAAHAFDQLEPSGTHYTRHLKPFELGSVGGLALLAAVGIGAYYAITVSPLLVPFIGLGVFFSFAYPLPSRVAGRYLHNNVSFAFSWGLLPFVTSFYVNSLSITPLALFAGTAAALVAWVEIRLSRLARRMRKETPANDAYRGPELGLRLLVFSVCSCAAATLLWRLT